MKFLRVTKAIRLIWALIIAIALVKLADRIFPTNPIEAFAMAFLGMALGAEMFARTMRPPKKKRKRAKKAKPILEYLRLVK